MNSSLETLRLLSDPTRLRLLALLLREELSVAELQEILGMAQSRISSQLALLRQAGFVADRHQHEVQGPRFRVRPFQVATAHEPMVNIAERNGHPAHPLRTEDSLLD